jgi:PAS domain-containing protein
MTFFSSLTYKQKYILFGVGFGGCFPLFALLIDGVWLKSLPLTSSFLFQIHAQNPIHFVIDSAPLVLGFVFGLAGRVAQNLHNLKESLELRVVERTHDLQASEEELRQNIEELQAIQTQMQESNEKLIALQQEEQEANEIFRALFEYSTDAHLLFDDTGIINCNPATVKLLGYETKDAILNLHPAKLSPATQPDGRESGEKAQEMDRLAQEKGFHKFEWQMEQIFLWKLRSILSN